MFMERTSYSFYKLSNNLSIKYKVKSRARCLKEHNKNRKEEVLNNFVRNLKLEIYSPAIN